MKNNQIKLPKIVQSLPGAIKNGIKSIKDKIIAINKFLNILKILYNHESRRLT